MLIAVNFHYVRQDFRAPYSAIQGETPEDLRRQIDELGRQVDFVSVAQLAAAARGEAALPSRACILTFDDGLREQVTLAVPVLEAAGVPAVFFPNTGAVRDRRVLTIHKLHLVRSRISPEDMVRRLEGFVGQLGRRVDIPEDAATGHYRYDSPIVARLKYGISFCLRKDEQSAFVDALFSDIFDDERAVADDLYMDRDMLRALDGRGWLGTHGHEHVSYATLSAEEMANDVATSMQLLKEWGMRNIVSVSYPFGGREACPPAAAAAAAAHGIAVGFTMERSVNRDLSRAPLFLGRYSCNDVVGGRHFRGDAESFFASAPEATYGEGVQP